MKRVFRKPLLIVLGAALMAPAALLAQSGENDKSKDKTKDKKDNEVITIIRKGDKKEKVVVEVDGDKVTVNGKPIDEYKDDDVSVRRTKVKDVYAFGDAFGGGFRDNFTYNLGKHITEKINDNIKNHFRAYTVDSNRAMLGVTTEKGEKGVEIQDVTKESAAAKAGLKEGDVISRINDSKIETPDDLSKVIKSHKPGDKVTVTYSRDGKEQKATAELGRWRGAHIFSATPEGQYNFDFGEGFDKYMPKIQTMPRVPGQNWSRTSGTPKLGLSVQDTDDSKGVKVIEVDHESNAEKAGIKVDDVITEVEGKATNSADEIAKIIRENKEKTSVMVKLTRGGKTHNIEVKIPRRLKTADL